MRHSWTVLDGAWASQLTESFCSSFGRAVLTPRWGTPTARQRWTLSTSSLRLKPAGRSSSCWGVGRTGQCEWMPDKMTGNSQTCVKRVAWGHWPVPALNSNMAASMKQSSWKLKRLLWPHENGCIYICMCIYLCVCAYTSIYVRQCYDLVMLWNSII